MTSALTTDSPASKDAHGVLSEIVQVLPHPILTIGPQGQILDVNDACEAFFEVSIRLLKRQNISDLLPFE